MDKTCMSYWLPKLEAADLPVPRTKMLTMSDEVRRDIFNLFDGAPMTGIAQPFMDELTNAAKEFGFPVFLRTGMTSGKHSWRDTCYWTDPVKVAHHVASIVEFSECCDMMGLSTRWWAVREFLPTTPVAVCPAFGDMPVVREWRCFVVDDAVQCVHPYWPQNALEMGGLDDAEHIAAEMAWCPLEGTIRELASKAGLAVGGEWSVDILETKRGLFVTDMAEARKSFHWPECSSLQRTSKQAK